MGAKIKCAWSKVRVGGIEKEFMNYKITRMGLGDTSGHSNVFYS